MKFTTALLAMFIGTAALLGCDDKKYERTVQQKTDDGTVVKQHEKVTKGNDGDTKVTKETSVDRP